MRDDYKEAAQDAKVVLLARIEAERAQRAAAGDFRPTWKRRIACYAITSKAELMPA